MLPVQEPPYLHHDDRALADAWRDGDLHAARRLVERHQPELLRIAFLLTGRADTAPGLVTATLLGFFKDTQRTPPSTDVRTALITNLAEHYLSDVAEPPGEPASVAPQPIANSPAPERFNVENERKRVRTALAGLQPAGRTAIVLADLVHLPDHLPCEVTNLTVLEIDAVRRRLRFTAGLDDDAPLHSPLAAAALDAPRVDLRESIEDALSEHRQSARRRARLINAGAVAVTVLVAVALVWFLLGLDDSPGSNTIGNEENIARNPDGQPALDRLESASATPLPPPTATPLPTPPADVPNILLVRIESTGGPATLLHRFTAGAQQVLSISGSGQFHEAAQPIVAPDGEQVVMLWHQYIDGDVRAIVTAHDGDLQRTEWAAEIAIRPFEATRGARPPIFLIGAVDDDRVYVIIHPWQSSEPVEIVALRRESGEIEARIETTVSGFVVQSIRAFAPSGHDTLYLFAISQDQPPQYGDLQIIFMAYHMPGGERIHGRTLADKPDSRAFFLYQSRLTPDGSHLYGVDYTNANGELAVHFLDLKQGRLEPRLLLPFEPVADPLPYQQVASHDGRWLYVLSPASRQVAVVDLTRRRLAGMVPLNLDGNLAGATVETRYFPDRQMQLSTDGRTIYALGAGLGPGKPRAGIWVIDVPTWSLIDVWIPDVPVARLVLAGKRDLYASLPRDVTVRWAAPASPVQVVPFEALSNSGPDGLETLAGLYRKVYGRSPSTGGWAPGVATDFYPLARMSVVVVDHRLDLDERAEIDVRFVNPLTNVPVFEGADEAGARYTSPASVRAVLTSAGEEVLLELGRASYGWYRGSVVLPSPGEWDLTIVARWSGEEADQRRLTYRQPIQVERLVGGFPGNALGIRSN